MSTHRALRISLKALLASAEVHVKPPPSDLIAPVTPEGFVAAPRRGRGIKPWRAELAVLPECIRELARFTRYATVFGSVAPPAEQVAQAFDAAGRWSSLRIATEAFLAYVKAEEGVAWKATRPSFDRLKASYSLGAAADPSLRTELPALAALFSAAKDAAKKAQATRKRDAKSKVPAEPPKAQSPSTEATRMPSILD